MLMSCALSSGDTFLLQRPENSTQTNKLLQKRWWFKSYRAWALVPNGWSYNLSKQEYLGGCQCLSWIGHWHKKCNDDPGPIGTHVISLSPLCAPRVICVSGGKHTEWWQVANLLNPIQILPPSWSLPPKWKSQHVQWQHQAKKHLPSGLDLDPKSSVKVLWVFFWLFLN